MRMFQVGIVAIVLLVTFTQSRLLQIAWVFLKTGLLSFGGAYAAIVFVQRGAVAEPVG
jgi:chromate transport protein ChrA